MYCVLKAQSLEIQQLKATVETLTDELEVLKCNRSQQCDCDPPPESAVDHHQSTALQLLSNSNTPRPTPQIISQPSLLFGQKIL